MCSSTDIFSMLFLTVIFIIVYWSWLLTVFFFGWKCCRIELIILQNAGDIVTCYELMSEVNLVSLKMTVRSSSNF